MLSPQGDSNRANQYHTTPMPVGEKYSRPSVARDPLLTSCGRSPRPTTESLPRQMYRADTPVATYPPRRISSRNFFAAIYFENEVSSYPGGLGGAMAFLRGANQHATGTRQSLQSTPTTCLQTHEKPHTNAMTASRRQDKHESYILTVTSIYCGYMACR